MSGAREDAAIGGIALMHGAGKLKSDPAWFLARQRMGAGLLAGFVAAAKTERSETLDRPESVCPAPVAYVEFGPSLFGDEHHEPLEALEGLAPGPRWQEQPRYRCTCCPTEGRARTNAREHSGVLTRGGMSWPVMQRTHPEVCRYLDRMPIRQSVIASVAAQLRTKRPRVLVAHSLGSVVAVDVLARLGDESQPELLVTLGSPLRLDVVRKRLDALSIEWLSRRRSIWLNLHDRGDIATGGKGLHHRRFPGVVNVAVSNGSHAHAADYYLRHPIVGQLIWDVADEEVGAEDLGSGLRDKDLARLRVKRHVQESNEQD